MNAFSEHLIKNGSVSKELGRLLKRAEEIRLVADYRGDSVELSDAQEMVIHAETFVAAMHVKCMANTSNDNDYGVEP